jgi:antitoxin component HigA of HigAB toxin-antitoxin module
VLAGSGIPRSTEDSDELRQKRSAHRKAWGFKSLLVQVNALAAKKILALQTERRMKELGLTTTTLAARMGTSRNQVHRVLDQDDAGITLKVLFRLSKALQMPLRVAFDEAPRKGRPGPRPLKTRGVAAHRGRASNRRRIVGNVAERR